MGQIDNAKNDINTESAREAEKKHSGFTLSLPEIGRRLVATDLHKKNTANEIASEKLISFYTGILNQHEALNDIQTPEQKSLYKQAAKQLSFLVTPETRNSIARNLIHPEKLIANYGDFLVDQTSTRETASTPIDPSDAEAAAEARAVSDVGYGRVVNNLNDAKKNNKK